MKLMECRLETTSGATEISKVTDENFNLDLSAGGALKITRSLTPGSLLGALHPCHLVCLLQPAALSLRLVYSGVSAICSVAPVAAALIAVTLLYLRVTRRHLERENHRVLWQRIVHAIGH